jgi:hypothetical protein
MAGHGKGKRIIPQEINVVFFTPYSPTALLASGPGFWQAAEKERESFPRKKCRRFFVVISNAKY